MNPNFNADNYLNADELAAYLGCANAVGLDYERKAGHVPAPDTVFEGLPYWSCSTAQALYVTWMNAFRKARGHEGIDPEAAPAPLSHEGVVMLRFLEGRHPPPKPFDPSKGTWGYIVGADGDQSEDRTR